LSSLVGDARIPRRSFELRLGDVAVQVWSYLCRLRDYYGTVTATVPGICRAKGFSKLKRRTAQRALMRLREAGLVRDLGFVWKRQDSGAPIRVYVREVRGAWAGREHVLVPTDTWGTVMKLPISRNHGGKREGAGVKKIQSTASEEVARRLRANLANAFRSWATSGKARPAFDDIHGFSYQAICEALGPCPGERSAWHIDHVKPLARFDLTQQAHVLEAMRPENHQWLPARANIQKGAKENWVDPRQVGAEEKHQKFEAVLNPTGHDRGAELGHDQEAPLSSYPLQVSKELVPSLRSGTHAAKQPAACTLQSSTEEAPNVAPKKAPKLKKPAATSLREVLPEGRERPASLFSTPKVGEGGTPATRARLEALGAFSGPFPGVTLPGLNGLPPHPTADETCSQLPPPPKVPTYEDIPEDKVRDAQLAFCAKWYRSAVESRVGRCRPIRMAGETRKYFEDALDVFLEHDIRPGAWVAWALDRILTKLPTNARKRFVPQTKMLLSPKTLTEGRWMFRESAGDYSVTALIPTRSGKEFGDRYRKLMLDVLGLPLRDRASIEPLVAAHFPEGASEARRIARENSMRVGQVVRERINEGRWVWQLPKALRE
jgi:hypothetical protein